MSKILINKNKCLYLQIITIFYYHVITCRCIGYTCIVLFAEVNSIFLHARKLLQMNKFPFDHWIYRTNMFLNLSTFMACRFVGIAIVANGMVNDRHRVGPVYYFFLAITVITVSIINFILFWRLLKNDVLRSKGSRSNKATASIINTNIQENIVPTFIDKKHQ